MASRPARSLQRSAVVLLALGVCVLLGTIIWPYSISQRAIGIQVRTRLRRVGLAINYWVEDHGRLHFPKIVNPPPRTLWRPDRQGAASVVLRPYLGGDIPPRRRKDESEQEFLRRQREKELTVDPRTGFEFLYNSQLLATDPGNVAAGQKEVRYFTCQDTAAGQAPYRHEGEAGAWSVYGEGEQTQVTEEVLLRRRERLTALEDRYAGLPPADWEEDLGHQQRQLHRLEKAFTERAATTGGERALTLTRLKAVVRFDPE